MFCAWCTGEPYILVYRLKTGEPMESCDDDCGVRGGGGGELNGVAGC